MFVCKDCCKQYRGTGALSHHKQSVHEHRRFVCQRCQKQYPRKDSLDFHLKPQHLSVIQRLQPKIQKPRRTRRPWQRKGSIQSSRVCKNTHGLIRKYGLNMCRRCFREYADDIGFKKLD